MKLHIFNPEHDVALALNKWAFTPSHNVAKIRRELAFLPALWADDGDIVIVEDVEYATKAAQRLQPYTKNVQFVTPDTVCRWNKDKNFRLRGISKVIPWGWDRAIVHTLKGMSIKLSLLPDTVLLSQIKTFSHRRTSMKFLKSIDSPFKAFEVTETKEITDYLNRYNSIVLKSPWSSSGRGVRFINKDSSTSILQWARNIIKTQGSIMVEPFYEKLRDFAIEFMVDSDGIHYCGLSLFKTYFTSYSASIIATEEEKMEILCRYTSRDYLYYIINVCRGYLEDTLPKGYSGGVGIDMMIVKDAEAERFLIHPCVEINLRRTMGHTALAIPTSPTTPAKLMVIEFERNFELKIKNI